MRPLATLLLAVAAPAFAADHELSLDVGTLVATERSFATFSDDAPLGTVGLRGAFALDDHFSIMAGYAHTRTGSRLEYYGDGTIQWVRAPVGAFFGNEISVGPRFDWKLWNFFVPYVRVDGLLLVADARFDDDPSDPRSPGQRKEMSVSGGFRPMTGIDFVIPRKNPGLSVGFYLEGGYTWLSPTRFETFGDVHLYGFTLRTGVGLRL